jgi:circadian clock protein KaiB
MNQRVSFKFRLYIAGSSPNSAKALANLKALCREVLDNRHEIEIVDVLKEPTRALEDGVLLTPMLVKFSPGPVRKIIGSLNHREPVLQALGLPLEES